MTLGKARYSKKLRQTRYSASNQVEVLETLFSSLDGKDQPTLLYLHLQMEGDLVEMLYPAFVPQRNKHILRLIWLWVLDCCCIISHHVATQ